VKIFTDYHHGDLYHSLHRLFECRLGHELYRPIGMEWFREGYWKIGDPYPTPEGKAKQYLSINKKGWIPFKNLNGEHEVEANAYRVRDRSHDYDHKALILEQFKSMKFDVVMPTFPGHDKPFEVLRDRFQPQAKLVMQMGNFRQRTHLPNVLHSNHYPDPLHDQHCLYYHQEIDGDLFSPEPPNAETKNVYGIIPLAPYISLYEEYRAYVTSANWKYYGHGGSPDGPLSGSRGVAEKMKEANVAWHTKQGAGHTTCGWFAVGRPLLTLMSLHRRAGGDALKLFDPGVTCIDLESGTAHENSKRIRELLQPNTNREWCERVWKRFESVVNYERDAERVERFLGDLR